MSAPTPPAPEVVVHDDKPALARAAAERAVAVLGDALADRPVAHLVVTGGSILEATLGELVEASRRIELDWSRVHVWWGDERYVPAGDADRNDVPARRTFDQLPVDPAKIHPMPASDTGFGDDLDAAAGSYAAELAALADSPEHAELPTLDVALIGIGPDGHCCSLFPGHPGLQVRDRTVAAIRESPKPPPQRLTLTFPTLDAVRHLWFVASGDGKADAVARAVGGAPLEQVPSAGPRGRVETVWLLDRDAAAQLPS